MTEKKMTSAGKAALELVKDCGVLTVLQSSKMCEYTLPHLRNVFVWLAGNGFIKQISGFRYYAVPTYSSNENYRAIYEFIAENGPSTKKQISEGLGMASGTLNERIKSHADEPFGIFQVGRIAGKPSAGGEAVYFIGNRSNASKGIKDVDAVCKRKTIGERMRDLVNEHGAMTQKEMAELLCEKQTKIESGIQSMRYKGGEEDGFYLECYKPDPTTRRMTSVWAFGAGEDAPKPEKLFAPKDKSDDGLLDESPDRPLPTLGNLGKETKELGVVMNSIWRSASAPLNHPMMHNGEAMKDISNLVGAFAAGVIATVLVGGYLFGAGQDSVFDSCKELGRAKSDAYVMACEVHKKN